MRDRLGHGPRANVISRYGGLPTGTWILVSGHAVSRVAAGTDSPQLSRAASQHLVKLEDLNDEEGGRN